MLQLLHLVFDHTDILLHVKFALAAIVVHVPDLTKNRSLSPSLQMWQVGE